MFMHKNNNSKYQLKIFNWNHIKKKTNKQNNCNDCGVFTMKFMDVLTDDLNVEIIKQKDILYHRQRIAFELMLGKVLDCVT